MTGRWPWPGDSPLARARKVAQAYREHLHTANPTVCAALDDTMTAYGEPWVVPQVITATDDQWLTPAQAADMLGMSVDSVGQLRRRGRLTGRKTRQGWRYRTADIRALAAQPRRRTTRNQAENVPGGRLAA